MLRRSVGEALLRAYLRILRRDQFFSLRLREEYRRRYQVDVGLYSYGCFDALRIRGPAQIGRYCSFADTARIVDANHPVERFSMHPFFYDAKFGIVPTRSIVSRLLVVEDDVWFGHHAIVLPSCERIGRGAVIAAGAVVTHDVAPYTIVAGVPAKVVRRRFSEQVIERIERLRWWEHSPKEAIRLLNRMVADEFPEGGAAKIASSAE